MKLQTRECSVTMKQSLVRDAQEQMTRECSLENHRKMQRNKRPEDAVLQ